MNPEPDTKQRREAVELRHPDLWWFDAFLHSFCRSIVKMHIARYTGVEREIPPELTPEKNQSPGDGGESGASNNDSLTSPPPLKKRKLFDSGTDSPGNVITHTVKFQGGEPEKAMTTAVRMVNHLHILEKTEFMRFLRLLRDPVSGIDPAIILGLDDDVDMLKAYLVHEGLVLKHCETDH